MLVGKPPRQWREADMANTITRATARRAALRRRLDARYPLFADELYRRDLDQFRAYFNGQPVPAPSYPRRRRPVHRPNDRKALAAFQVRQLDLMAWRRPGLARRVLRAAGRFLRDILGKVVAGITKGRTVTAPRHRQT